MTEQQEAAMRMALEALESYHGYMEPLTTVFGGPRVPAEQSTTGKVEKAITALRRALEQQPDEEPVAFQIFKPTPPRHAIPNVRDAELPWVYDQDPSSGNVASMWVTPVARPQPAAPAIPEGMALVPKRMTKAMRYVTDQGDWTWEDLLRAAEAITEAEYNLLAAALEKEEN